MSTPDSCWPTSAQQLLLKALLLHGTEAVGAWQQWTRAVELDDLDAESIRLLPQLYRSLKREAVRDPTMRKLKGVYRHTWYGNHVRLRDAAVVIGELRRRGIDAMLLKGMALTLLHYRDVGLRPMDDVDILVRTRQWRPAVETLTGLGWRPRVPVTPRHAEASHAMDFANAQDQRIDLHWHLLPDSCWPSADDEYWAHASATTLHGVPVSVLAATDQLFHACVHGVRWEPVPPVRWVADAAVILNDPAVEIDWNRLVRLAERQRLTLPLRHGLAYLEAAFSLPVPAHVLTELRETHVSRGERREYLLRTRPASPVLGRLREHWLRYRRLRRTCPRPAAVGFVGYLQVALDCDGPGALVRRAFYRRRWRRLAERAAWHRQRAFRETQFP